MLITVFTPTYNRAQLLDKAYQSLCRQDCKDFEWLIVDDGSTDDTASKVSSFCSESKINIRYIQKENGGKHTAINCGVNAAEGKLFYILDSDDSVPEGALQIIAQRYWDIAEDQTICGICGYMAHHDGTVIGRPIYQNLPDCTSLDMRYKYGIKGDMREIFKTSVLKAFLFPEISGERFCPEALVWNRIALKYKLRLIPDVIYYADYLDTGLTSQIVGLRMHSPQASMLCYAELNACPIPWSQKLKAAINYWRFRFCARSKPLTTLPLAWHFVALPAGYIMHLKDKKKK